MRNRITPPDYPDWLDERARRYWPSVDEWPTTGAVKRFARETRRLPDVRLSMLNALRYRTAADGQPIVAWLGVLIGFTPILLVTTSGIIWLQTSLAAAIALGSLVLFSRLSTIHVEIEMQRRRAIVWLRAFEDATKQ